MTGPNASSAWAETLNADSRGTPSQVSPFFPCGMCTVGTLCFASLFKITDKSGDRWGLASHLQLHILLIKPLKQKKIKNHFQREHFFLSSIFHELNTQVSSLL